MLNGWVRRAIPTEKAVQTAVRTADDGHTIRADLFGMGATLGEPCRLVVTCEPRTVERRIPPGGPFHELDGPEPATIERWPTMMELIEAADELAAGIVLSLQFFGNPKGIERIPVPPGAVRSFICTEVGRIRDGSIVLASA